MAGRCADKSYIKHAAATATAASCCCIMLLHHDDAAADDDDDGRHHCQCCMRYHGVGNVYLINSQTLQIGIGIGIGKFSISNSEELHIGKFWGHGSLKGDRNRHR